MFILARAATYSTLFVGFVLVFVPARVLAAAGIVHSSTTAALWFFSGGVTLVLTGAINLLNRSYGSAAAGLRRVCIATNAGMTVFAFVSGVAGRAGVPQLVTVVGWFAATTILSSFRAARAVLPAP